MEKPPLPESTILSLKSPETFKKWHESKTRTKESYSEDALKREAWLFNGDRSFEDEFGNLSADVLICGKKLIKQNRDVIKIVSFGGGSLRGVIELREQLMEYAQTLKSAPHIQIEDFSLTKKLGLQGLEDAGKTDLLKNGVIRLHIGPIELRGLKDAYGADIEVSAKGPFYHSHDPTQLVEIVVKAAQTLASNGKAFFETAFYGHPDLDRPMIDQVKEFLGSEFIVEARPGKNGGGFFIISRLDKE